MAQHTLAFAACDCGRRGRAVSLTIAHRRTVYVHPRIPNRIVRWRLSYELLSNSTVEVTSALR
eukprot:5317335-Pleurochrysis_carterae.AAC.3